MTFGLQTNDWKVTDCRQSRPSFLHRHTIDFHPHLLPSSTASHRICFLIDGGCSSQFDVIDIGISDHQLLCWEISATRVAPASVLVCSQSETFSVCPVGIKAVSLMTGLMTLTTWLLCMTAPTLMRH